MSNKFPDNIYITIINLLLYRKITLAIDRSNFLKIISNFEILYFLTLIISEVEIFTTAYNSI